jgi:hypothetical protein
VLFVVVKSRTYPVQDSLDFEHEIYDGTGGTEIVDKRVKIPKG